MTTTRTHSAIATIAKGVVESIQFPTSDPGPGEVVVKVAYSTIVAPDVYMTDHGMFINPEDYPVPLGLNVSGIVGAVGDGVTRLKEGDRVCAFTLTEKKSKGLQTKAVIHQTLCAQIPDNLGLEAAVTIPDNFVTAFYTLFEELGLPPPKSFPVTSSPPDANNPILIYGAGATTGQYAIQLLKLVGYTNVIATASSHNHAYLRSLGARHTIDYKFPDMADQIIRAAGGKVRLAMDCISAEGTLKRVAQVVQSDAKVALLLPIKEGDSVITESGAAWMSVPPDRNPFEKGVKVIGVKTFLYQENEYMKEKLMPEILPQLLKDNLIQPSRIRMFDHGTFLERALDALELVRSGKVSGEKVVVKVA
ncbi:chaperonin 10-like protein [Scleroderma yunnanense]